MNKIPVGSPTSWEWAAAGATLTVAETQVFSGTIPSSWTDLNLSGIIGSQESIVLLKIKVSSARFVAFRKNGDTDEFYCASDNPGGCAFFRSYSSEHKVVVVATDAAGIVEWKSTGATTATVDIIAYIK